MPNTHYVYAVVLWTVPSKHGNPLVIRVSATSEEEAERKAKAQFAGETSILSIRKIKTLEDNCLDLLWEAYPDLYLEIWEPDITSEEFLKKLKKTSPALYKGFMEW